MKKHSCQINLLLRFILKRVHFTLTQDPTSILFMLLVLDMFSLKTELYKGRRGNISDLEKVKTLQRDTVPLPSDTRNGSRHTRDNSNLLGEFPAGRGWRLKPGAGRRRPWLPQKPHRVLVSRQITSQEALEQRP